jgi:predicted DCC family thiol-disulfide oxidoreductase YuxK
MPKPLVTVFYDGHCALCHGFIRFLLARDPLGIKFDFAPLQGEFCAATIPDSERTRLPDSVVVRRPDGQLLVKSQAVEYVLNRIGGFWRLCGSVAGLLPRNLLDGCYDGVAAARRKLRGVPPDICPAVAPELRARFHE